MFSRSCPVTRLFNISVNRIFRAGPIPALFGSDRQRRDTAAAGRRVCAAIALPIARSYWIGLYHCIRLFSVETDISRNSGPEVNAFGKGLFLSPLNVNSSAGIQLK